MDGERWERPDPFDTLGLTTPFADEDFAPEAIEGEASFRLLPSPFVDATIETEAERAKPRHRARRAGPQPDYLGGLNWTFVARTGRMKVAVFVSKAALARDRVEVLLYIHGLLNPCGGLTVRPAGLISSEGFRLGPTVDASGRPMVLVIPLMQEGDDKSWTTRGLETPAGLNALIAEVLAQVGARQGRAPPELSAFIVAGHSRAFGVLYPLGRSHGLVEHGKGALAHLTQIWLLDATYGSPPLRDYKKLVDALPSLSIQIVYRRGSRGTDKFDGKEKQGRLGLRPLDAKVTSHCAVPAHVLPDLLGHADQAQGFAGDDEEPEAFDDPMQLAADSSAQGSLPWTPGATETEWLYAPADEWLGEAALGGAADEWLEAEREQDDEAPGRFDAFDDERDADWEDQEGDDPYARNEGSQSEATLASAAAADSLTPAERKALEITSTLETGKRGGFFGLSGNFDGQGLSFGLVNWTIGTGSLQPLLRALATEQPARWAAAFGPDASRFRAVVMPTGKEAEAAQKQFAIAEMNVRTVTKKGKVKWAIREPWATYFKRLSEDTEFQKIQIRFVRDLLLRADYFCRRFALKSEAAYAFMFDAVSSHGKWWLTKKIGGRQKRRLLLEPRLQALSQRFGEGGVPESEVLLAIADVLGATSAPRWAQQARVRKRWFVTGEHPRAAELKGLEPRLDVAYSIGAQRPPGSHESADAVFEDESTPDAAIRQARNGGQPADRQALLETLAANNTTIEAWFAKHRGDARFLGMKIEGSGEGRVAGVHQKLLDVLDRAANTLLANNPGSTAAALRKKLGIRTIGGMRPPKKATGGSQQSLHCFGLAIDINHPTNPFVGNFKGKNESYRKNRSPAIIRRAMWLLRGEKFNIEKPLKGNAGAVWDIHDRASKTLAEYLRLADDPGSDRVKQLVETLHSTATPPTSTERTDQGLPWSLDEWKQRITLDRQLIPKYDFGHHPHPELSGYMDLPRELVLALTGAGLGWGGQYRGAKDIMHFGLEAITRPVAQKRKKVREAFEPGDEGEDEELAWLDFEAAGLGDDEEPWPESEDPGPASQQATAYDWERSDDSRVTDERGAEEEVDLEAPWADDAKTDQEESWLGDALKEFTPQDESEMESGTAKPVLFLDSFVAGREVAPFQARGAGRFHATLCRPFFSSPAMELEVRGRLRLTQDGVTRAFSKADRKAFAKLTAVTRARPAGGVTASTGQVSVVRDDGSFVAPIHVVLDPGTWLLSMQVAVEWRGGGKITADAIVSSSELACFTTLVDPLEATREAAQSHFEFMAAVRKMFQPSPASSLKELFPRILDKTIKVAPLYKPTDPGALAFQRFQQGLKIRGEDIDIGHVLVGIEAHRRQGAQASGAPVQWSPARIETLMTWGGDLGSVLAHVAHGTPTGNASASDIPRLLAGKASYADLRGDLDGLNIGATYDRDRSLAANLREYYEAPKLQRFNEFIANTLDDQGKPMFQLLPGKPARVDPAGGAAIAEWIRFFAVGYILFSLRSGRFSLTDDEYRAAQSVAEPRSKESNMVVAYFLDFLNKGLAGES